MKVLIFGSQGSGKSTHGKYIAEKLGVPYISTGDIFRNIVKDKSPLGEKVKSALDKGEFVSEDITREVLEESFQKNNIEKGFVLDGYPRNLNQAEAFAESIDAVFFIKVPQDLAVSRLMERKREDDKPELIRKRIELYNEKTASLVDYYRNRGVQIFEIDNSPPLEVVQKKIDDYFEN